MNLRKRYKVLEMMSQQKQIHMNGVAKMGAKVQSFSEGTLSWKDWEVRKHQQDHKFVCLKGEREKTHLQTSKQGLELRIL